MTARDPLAPRLTAFGTSAGTSARGSPKDYHLARPVATRANVGGPVAKGAWLTEGSTTAGVTCSGNEHFGGVEGRQSVDGSTDVEKSRIGVDVHGQVDR